MAIRPRQLRAQRTAPSVPSTDNRIQFRIGLIAAAAALLGSAIGGVVSVIVTDKTLNSQAHITDKTLSAQFDQSREEFLRSERKDAYAHMLRLNQQINERNYRLILRMKSPPVSEATQRYYRRVIFREGNDMDEAYMQLSIVGAPSTLKSARELVIESAAYGRSVLHAAATVEVSRPAHIVNHAREAGSLANEARDRFLEDVRKSLRADRN